MATKTLTQHICDRCEKVYSETDPVVAQPDKKGSGPVPTTDQPRPKLMLEVIPLDGKEGGYDSLTFRDLCPKCHSRVLDLVKNMRLESKEEKEAEKPKTPEKAEKDAAAPKEGKPEKTDHKPVDTSAKPADNKAKDAKASEAKA